MYTGHSVLNTNISNPIPNERMNKTDSSQKKKKMPKKYMTIMFKIFSPRKCKSKTTVRSWRGGTVVKRACSIIMLASITSQQAWNKLQISTVRIQRQENFSTPDSGKPCFRGIGTKWSRGEISSGFWAHSHPATHTYYPPSNHKSVQITLKTKLHWHSVSPPGKIAVNQ